MASRLARVAAWVVLALAAAAAHAQTVTRPLASLRPAGGAAAAAHAFVVELAPREALSGVHLALVTKPPPAMGSRYVVWVNGAVAADVEAIGAAQTLALAPDAFTPGVNTIQLALLPSAVSPSGDGAARAPAPVDDARSSLSLDFAGLRPNSAPTLAQLALAFDARAWLPHTVTVDLGEGDVSAEQVRAAAIAVQGVAGRMRQPGLTVDYRSDATLAPWKVDPESWGLAQDDIAAGDIVLVGTRTALSRALPASVERAVTGPFLGIYPINGGRSVAVVISGVSDADCVRAAKLFADGSAAMPASAAMVLGNGLAGRPPAVSLNVALAENDPALVRALLRFAAVRAYATADVADYGVRFSASISGASLFLGRESSLPARAQRHLPVYAPLQPGQAVSLPARVDGQPFVAIVGVREATVADAVEMLREPAAWTRFSQHALLFDTRGRTMVALAVATRTPLAVARMFIADPLVFWPVLGLLLLASFVFVNLALKAQVVERLRAAGERPSHETRNETT